MVTLLQDNLAIAPTARQTGKEIAISPKRGKRHWSQDVRRWHRQWSHECCIVSGETAETAVAAKSQLKSRAPVQLYFRKRAVGGGRPYINHAVRQGLYEWFASIRHAIDWNALISNNRGRGLKKNGEAPNFDSESEGRSVAARARARVLIERDACAYIHAKQSVVRQMV